MLFKSAMLVAISLIVATLAFGVLKPSQSNQDAAKATEQNLAGREKKSPLAAKEDDDAATPVVDLIGSYTAGVSTDRWFKNNRYDNEGMVKSEIDSRAAAVLREPPGGISDIPTDTSDLVVEGTVTDSAAFLSNDKGAVYTEITVRVSYVLKDTSNLNVGNGDSIVTERFGGRVKYPNGQVVRYGFVGQGSPAKGKKYLFFLSRAERVITTY